MLNVAGCIFVQQIEYPCPTYFKAYLTLWGEPWLFSANASRSHLSTYIPSLYVIINLTKAAKHKAFSQMEGVNSLQFLLMMEVLLENHLTLLGLRISSGKSVPFPVARRYNVWHQRVASGK